MKTSIIIIISILIILWESFLGHTRLVGNLDIFSSLFITVFLLRRQYRGSFIYISFLLALFLDLVIGRDIGVYVLALFIPLLLLGFVDKVIKIFQQDKQYLAVMIFLAINQLIVYSLVIINGGSFFLNDYVSRLLPNIFLSIIFYFILSRNKEREAIKV